ncbi:PR domain zinc finger protein 2-like [Alexandromys fortis]|uniref:PR domain zinc finger protein 2-like n=1 Tax=Alexandromys fortis TaxID=100897 RepID=UPI002152FCC5|nr:PR domain zinc finger protein 2-like [Microtus fortis]
MWPSLLRRASLRHGRAGKEAGPAAPSAIRDHSAPVCAPCLCTTPASRNGTAGRSAPPHQPTRTLSYPCPCFGSSPFPPTSPASFPSSLSLSSSPCSSSSPSPAHPSLLCSPISPGPFSSLCSFSPVAPYSFSSPQPPSCSDPCSSSPCSRSCTWSPTTRRREIKEVARDHLLLEASEAKSSCCWHEPEPFLLEMDLELEGVRESVAKKFGERSMCDKVVSATMKIRADQSAIPSNHDCGPEVLRLTLPHLSRDSLSPTNHSSR